MDALCGARVLVLNVTVESELTNAMHLTPASARIIVERVRPEIAVLTHFSQWLLESGPGAIASWLERETGSWVVAADDGLVVDVGRTISLASDSRPARLSEIESASAGRRCNGLGGPGSASDPPSAGPKDIT